MGYVMTFAESIAALRRADALARHMHYSHRAVFSSARVSQCLADFDFAGAALYTKRTNEYLQLAKEWQVRAE